MKKSVFGKILFTTETQRSLSADILLFSFEGKENNNYKPHGNAIVLFNYSYISDSALTAIRL